MKKNMTRTEICCRFRKGKMEYASLKLFNLKKYCVLIKHAFSNIFISKAKTAAFVIVVTGITLFNILILPQFFTTEFLKLYILFSTSLFECILLVFFVFSVGKVKGYDDFVLAFNSVGMKNSIGATPIPVNYKIEKNKVFTYLFYCPSFTIPMWNDYAEKLQSALNIFIINVSETDRKDFIELKIIKKTLFFREMWNGILQKIWILKSMIGLL